ncbi:MAG: hypothetical protein MI749_20835 [Desulfovibrionales bacterium]|nr:hypothetical protein [Desulfovibrionales bacterium]
MFVDASHGEELNALLKNWTDTEAKAKEAFVGFKDFLLSLEGVTLSFKSRPGVSYSIRAKHENQVGREFFVVVDVVDDDPADRWLSVCFYAEMINDTEELGDWVPKGLEEKYDACCFNIDEDDANLRAYVKDRIIEAYESAKK